LLERAFSLRTLDVDVDPLAIFRAFREAINPISIYHQPP